MAEQSKTSFDLPRKAQDGAQCNAVQADCSSPDLNRPTEEFVLPLTNWKLWEVRPPNDQHTKRQRVAGS